MNDASSTDAPRVLPGLLQHRAEEERANIAIALHKLNGDRMTLVDRRKAKLDEIARLQREVVEYEASIAACDEEREDLIVCDDALAEEQRALERLLIRRAGQ